MLHLSRNYGRKFYLILQEAYVLDTCYSCLIEHSNQHIKQVFYGEIRIKKNISYISFCSLRILYNSKFILMAVCLETNVVVTRIHCITNFWLKNALLSGAVQSGQDLVGFPTICRHENMPIY